jgi:hypothetical protein
MLYVQEKQMILGLSHFKVPHRRTVNDLKLAIGLTCKDLDIMCDIRLMTAWKVWLDESDRAAFIELVNEALK